MLYALAIEPFLHKLRKELVGLKSPKCIDAFKLSAVVEYTESVRTMTQVLQRRRSALTSVE